LRHLHFKIMLLKLSRMFGVKGEIMKNMGTAATVAALISAGLASPAYAAKADFISCDGLRAPKSKGDGMEQASSDTYGFRSSISPNWVSQISACNRALADPMLLPTHNLRKVNLLRARALGYFGSGEHDKALAEIDAAEMVGATFASDALYPRSMAVSLTLIRAAIWSAKGDTAKASTFARAAADVRPYSNRVQSVVTSILRFNNADASGGSSPYARLLPLSPDTVFGQFGYLISNGNFGSAIKQFPRLKMEFPKIQAGTFFSNRFSPAEEKLVQSLISSLDGAYAFATTGDIARAKAILADTRAKFGEALQPVVQPGGVSPPPSRLEDGLKKYLDQRAMLIDGRIAIAENRSTDALKALVGQAVPVDSVGVNLLTALRTALPEAQRALAPDPEALKTKLIEQRKQDLISVEALQRALPEPETSNRITDYKKSSKPLLSRLLLVGAGGARGYQPDGFRSKLDSATGVTTVEYIGAQASATVVEELTLLHAADLARKQSKAGFLIVARRDFTRTITTTQGFSSIPISSRPAGFKTEMDVQFVDPANLPAALASESDRVLIADKVYANLAPIYITEP
jgi:hypothetical protein